MVKMASSTDDNYKYIKSVYIKEEVAILSSDDENSMYRPVELAEMRNVRQVILQKCTECNKFFKNLPHHVKYRCKPLFCNLCDHKEFSKLDLLRHLRLVHKGGYGEISRHKCSKCEKSYKFRCDMTRHERKCGENNYRQCPKCSKFFRCLQHHLKYQCKQLACNLCDHKAFSKLDLKRHVRIEHQSLQCQKCNYVGKNSGSLRAHYYYKHKNQKN